MAIDLGDPLPDLSIEIRNAAGQLENAGSVALTITLPDATTATPTVTNPSTGIYEATYLTVQAGRHLARWVATGLNASAHTDAYLVRPANPAMAISLAEAKAHLGEQSTLQDEEIRDYIQVATEIIEQFVGPLGVRSYTERVRNGTDRFKLRCKPIVTVASVTSIRFSTTYATADLDVDQEYGIVYRKNEQEFLNGPWTVAYTAGHTQVPERWVEAVKEQLWSMWYSQRGQLADSTIPDLTDVADFESRVPFGLGFLIPYRVMQLIEHDHVPGFA